MIIFMEENADMQKTANVAANLICQGFSLRVENKNGNGRFVLAVLSLAAKNLDVALLEKMPGVGECVANNEYYSKNYFHFEDPYTLFSWGV